MRQLRLVRPPGPRSDCAPPFALRARDVEGDGVLHVLRALCRQGVAALQVSLLLLATLVDAAQPLVRGAPRGHVLGETPVMVLGQ
eukprot:8983786-Alexandrium_andersonii.AAC.1